MAESFSGEYKANTDIKNGFRGVPVEEGDTLHIFKVNTPSSDAEYAIYSRDPKYAEKMDSYTMVKSMMDRVTPRPQEPNRPEEYLVGYASEAQVRNLVKHLTRVANRE